MSPCTILKGQYNMSFWITGSVNSLQTTCKKSNIVFSGLIEVWFFDSSLKIHPSSVNERYVGIVLFLTSLTIISTLLSRNKPKHAYKVPRSFQITVIFPKILF